MGHLARWKGLLIDNLLAATLVLADGSVAHVDSRDGAELFWALRGGGTNFGVLVSMTLRAFKIGLDLEGDDTTGKGQGGHAMPGKVFGGMRVLRRGKGFPLGNRIGQAAVVTRWLEYCLHAPPEVSSNLIMPFGAPVLVQEYTYKGGGVASARAEAKQWRANGRGVVSLLKPRSYFRDVQRFVGDMEEKIAKKGGVPSRLLSILAAQLPPAAVEILCHATGKGRPKGVGAGAVIVQALGGKIGAPPDDVIDATAYCQRGCPFWVVVSATYSQPGKQPTARQLETLDRFLLDLGTKLQPHVITPSLGAISIGAPYAAGAPGGRTGDGGFEGFQPGFQPGLAGSLYTEAAAERLRAIKSRYDPHGAFWAVECGMSASPVIAPSAI